MLAASAPWAAAEALGASAPELAAFQDEPLQMKSGTVGKTGFLRLGFERRGQPHDPGEPRAPRALHGAARAVLRPGNAGPGLRVPDHDHRLPPAGRPACSRHHARSGRAGARHHAVGDQDPRDGRQLRGANADHHACRRCIPGISSRSCDPASARALRQRHANLHRSDRDASLFGDHPTWPEASSSGRVLRRHRDVDVDRRGAPGRPHVVHREAGDRAAAISDAADGRDGFVRRVRQCDPVHAQGQRRSHLCSASRPTWILRAAWRSAPAGCPTMPA